MPRDSSCDAQPDIVLAGDLVYGAGSPPLELTKAKFAVKSKFFALPVATALSILCAAAIAGGFVSANHSGQQQSQTRGVGFEQDIKAQVASELSGHYFALVIGINNYEHLPKLATPVADAKALASVLHDLYGFQTTMLLDATHDQITKAMFEYRRTLDENANLLIYFAGHGIYDKDAGKAYWLPVDADPNDPSHWIGAESISTAAKVISARHVLIISDSCYSGGLTRDVEFSVTPQEHERYIEKEASHKSRNLMSSGALEPVADGGGSGHSVFTGTLINALVAYDEQIFVAEDIFQNYVKEAVSGRSEQSPQYVPIGNSGHEYGDFVFVRSGKAPAASAGQRAEHKAEPQTVTSQPATVGKPGAPRQPTKSPDAGPGEVHAKNVLASGTYGGIRFEVKSVNINKSKAPVVQIAATNMQGRDLKFKILVPLEPKVIDSNGVSNTWYTVEGVPVCGGGIARCAATDPNSWSVAHSGTPLNFAVNFSGTKDFRGSSASVSFNVLLGAEKDDGTIKPTLVSVVLPNVPLNPDVHARPALANQTYGGIRFDVISAQTGDKAVNVLIAATNTGQRDLKFKILTPLDPKVIDSNGISNTWYTVEGVQICGGSIARCATPDPNSWSVAYSGIPLEFVLPFTGTQDFHGSSASISFNVLLGTERDDGTIKPTLVPVVLPNVLLNPDAPVRPALANRTYEGIRFDVMSARAGNKAVNVLIAATNTQQRDLKFKILTPPDPKVIDSNGISNTWISVEGVPVCGGGVARCATTDPNGWSVAYSGIPLEFVLPFTGTQDFHGSSVSVSFNVLLGTEKDDGTIKATPVSVALPDVPLSQ